MKEDTDLKNEFFKLNTESTEIFNELYRNYESLQKDHELLHRNYESLKEENTDLINKKVESTLEVNEKFGIVNLAKLNGEAVFDAINRFNKLCPYCKTDLYSGHLRNNYEIDHFYPIAKGGQDVPWNLLPICRNCNRKKRDKLPFEYLDETTYNECNEYLESVLFKVTNNHEDRLQRDEIIHNLLMNLSLNKHNTDKFVNELYMLYNMPLSHKKIEMLDMAQVKNEILFNKDHLFGTSCGTYTTEKKVADFLFKKHPTIEQKKILKEVMRGLFADCRLSSNASYYSVKDCKVKLDTMEQFSDPNNNIENNLPDK